jgi:cation diffusion facilitator CzcD-associated flavoprotein CzcO
MKLNMNQLPVAIIGAGPIGLAMAAKLAIKNIPFVLLDKSLHVAASLKDWGHVSVFTPWEMNIDLDAKALLSKSKWIAPDPAGIATGQEIRNSYLLPLSELPEIKPNIRLGVEVTRIVRLGLDKTSIADRSGTPFKVTWYDTIAKNEQTLMARSIIDASGVWNSPNPMGVDGFPVAGESENSDVITYGIPDILGSDREKYLGKKVLIVGSGHSAMASIFGLDELNSVDPKGATFWLMRRGKILNNLNMNSNDPLPARHALNTALPNIISKSSTTVFAPSSDHTPTETQFHAGISLLLLEPSAAGRPYFPRPPLR